MLPLLQIGPLTIRTPGLILLAGLWFSLETASRRGTARGLNEDRCFSLGFYAVIAGIVAARLAFVVAHFAVYSGLGSIGRVLGSIFSLSPGTEIVPVGLVGCLVCAIALARLWRIPMVQLADSYAPALAMMGVAIGVANLLGGEMYGVETDLPWAIPLWGGIRHPTQLYFAIACLGLYGVLWRVEKTQPQGGVMTRTLLLGIGVILLLIEPLRADSPTLIEGIRTWQVIGLVMILAGMSLFAWHAPERISETASS
jgi:phosphatidylglycerol---prolipoprotein diacylglyceryl transferase